MPTYIFVIEHVRKEYIKVESVDPSPQNALQELQAMSDEDLTAAAYASDPETRSIYHGGTDDDDNPA